jgi:hypothetical protein
LRTIQGSIKSAEDWKRQIELRVSKGISAEQGRGNGQSDAEILISSVFELTPTSSSSSSHLSTNPMVPSSIARLDESDLARNAGTTTDFPKNLHRALVISGVMIGNSKVYGFAIRAWILSLLVGTPILVVYVVSCVSSTSSNLLLSLPHTLFCALSKIISNSLTQDYNTVVGRMLPWECTSSFVAESGEPLPCLLVLATNTSTFVACIVNLMLYCWLLKNGKGAALRALSSHKNFMAFAVDRFSLFCFANWVLTAVSMMVTSPIIALETQLTKQEENQRNLTLVGTQNF